MHRSHLVGLQQGEGLLHAAEKSGEDRWNGFRGKARLEGNVEEFLATVKQKKGNYSAFFWSDVTMTRRKELRERGRRRRTIR